MNTDVAGAPPVKTYPGHLLEDCAAAMDPRPEVLINSPGHEYHNHRARYVRNLVGDEKALVNVYDHVHVALPLNQIIVNPVGGVACR